MSSDEIKKQIQELESLQAQTRLWRVCAVLGILLILAVGVGKLIQSAVSLAQPGERRDKLVSTFMAGVKKDVVPDVERIGKRTLAEIKPAVEAELKKLNGRAPEIGDAFMKELDLLSTNIRREGTKTVYDTVGAMLKKREEHIRKMYPDVTDEKVAALANNLVEQANEHLLELSDRLFAEHIKSLGGITEHVHEIQRTEKISGDEDLPTWEMAMIVVDLVRDEMKDFDSTDSGKEAPKAGKTGTSTKKETKP